MKKSKHQKTAAWILLAGGTTLALTGAVIAGQDHSSELGYGDNFGTGMFLVGAGLVADIGSIPLFISSSNHARMAATISLRNQQIGVPQRNGYALKLQPAITLTIPLR